MASSTDLELLGRGFESHLPPLIHFYESPHVELDTCSPRLPQQGGSGGSGVDSYTRARISGQPRIPPVQWGRVSKSLLVTRLPVAKRTIDDTL